MKYVLGVDLGTSSLKAALFDENLSAVGRAKVDYGTEYPASGWAEQDAGQWWKALKGAIAEIFGADGAPSAKDVEVVAVDAMTPTIVPVDPDGEPLRNALIWMDRRAEAEVRAISESLGDEVFRLAGNPPDSSCAAPKVLWLKRHEPKVYSASHRILFANAFLVHRLTGEFTADASNCGMSLLCDTRNGEWSDVLFDGSHLDREKFPEILECGEIAGTVSAKAARETGLSVRTKVIAGAMDNVAAVLGTGTIEDMDLCISAGTAANVNLCASSPRFHPSFFSYRHIVPGRWIHAGGVDYGGAGYKWFANLIGESDYAALDRRAGAAAPGEKPLVFLPYMVGQRAPMWNSRTRGVLFGLDPSMGDGEVARALMEGNAHGVRTILEMMGKLGARPASCRLTGGCAESAVYSQVFADVLGLPVHRVGKMDAAVLGIAMAGARAAGFYEDYEQMSEIVAVRASHLPSESLRKHYSEAHALFDRLREVLEPLYGELSSLGFGGESIE